MLKALAKDSEKTDRVDVRLKISAKTAALVEELRKRSGNVPRETIMERFFEWLNSQPETVQDAFIKGVGDPVTELISIRLAQVGGDINKLPFKDAASIAKSIKAGIDTLAMLAVEHEKSIALVMKKRAGGSDGGQTR